MLGALQSTFGESAFLHKSGDALTAAVGYLRAAFSRKPWGRGASPIRTWVLQLEEALWTRC
jgi:hypothetical protein